MNGMRRKPRQFKESTDRAREQLNADVENFLATGGKVQQIASGVYGEKRHTLSPQQRKRMVNA